MSPEPQPTADQWEWFPPALAEFLLDVAADPEPARAYRRSPERRQWPLWDKLLGDDRPAGPGATSVR